MDKPSLEPVGDHPIPVAISYLRFSKDVQKKGNSTKRQSERSKAWCDRHGIELNESLRFDDRGVSAYRGKNTRLGALGQIIALAEEGERIWPGCYLVVENLDRISRQEIDEAEDLVKRILRTGVRIVTLSPERIYSRESKGLIQSIEILLHLERANAESRMKSERIRAAWAEKRRIAGSKPMTAQGPRWLELKDGSWKLLPKRVAVVRRIFEQYASGIGLATIASELNSKNIPTLRNGKSWSTSVLSRLLRNAAVIGQCQRYVYCPKDGVTRIPDGDPIDGYFPVIVSDETYWACQAKLASKGKPRGVSHASTTNLFPQLVWNPQAERFMAITNNRRGDQHWKLGVANRGTVGDKHMSVSGEVFESVMLRLIDTIDLKKLRRQDTAPEDLEITQLATKVERLTHQILVIEEELEDSPANRALIRNLARLSDELDDSSSRLTALQRIQSSDTARVAKQCREVAAAMKVLDPADLSAARARLRSLMPTFINRIHLVAVPTIYNGRIGIVTVDFHNGHSEQLVFCTIDVDDADLPQWVFEVDAAKFDEWDEEHKGITEEIVVLTQRDKGVIAAYESGMSSREIAEQFDMTNTGILAILHRHQAFKGPKKKGGVGPMTEPQEIHKKIIALRKAGKLTVGQIAEKLGCSRSLVTSTTAKFAPELQDKARRWKPTTRKRREVNRRKAKLSGSPPRRKSA